MGLTWQLAFGIIVSKKTGNADFPARREMTNEKLLTAVARVAAMKNAGMPDSQIATACGVSIDVLEKVYEKDSYKTEIAKIAEESFDKFNTLNEGWDMIENNAMNKVAEHLNKMPDPEFALRAAVMANKAQRRGRHTNTPIAAIPNSQVTIQLTANFADRMQTNFAVEQRKPEAIQQKDNNFLAPKKVQALLGKVVKPNLEVELASEFGDFQPVM